MKIALSLLLNLILFSSISIAESPGKCVVKEGSEAHSNFCNMQSFNSCKVHSMCEWEKQISKTFTLVDGKNKKTVTLIEEVTHKCESKPGMDAHSGFCSNLSQMACTGHSSLCQWQ